MQLYLSLHWNEAWKKIVMKAFSPAAEIKDFYQF